MFRIESYHFVVVRNRLIEFLLGAPRAAATDVGINVFGIEPNRFVEIGNRLIVLLLNVPEIAAVIVVSRLGRREPNCVTEVLNGIIDFPCKFPCDSTGVVSGVVLWILPNSFGEECNRVFEQYGVGLVKPTNEACTRLHLDFALLLGQDAVID